MTNASIPNALISTKTRRNLPAGRWRTVLAAALSSMLMATAPAVVHAQQAEPLAEWEKRQNADDRLRAYGTDLLGDGIDPHTGSLSFQHTDVSLPGNSNLEVAVRRKISPGEFYSRTVRTEFGDWQLDVPRIHVVHTVGTFQGNRCSNSYNVSLPSFSTWSGTTTPNSEYSEGVIMNAPGSGSIQVLEYTQPDARWPTQATHVSTEGWWFRCISASDGGQGFEAHAPNGDVYTLDRVIVHNAPSLGSSGSSFISRERTILAATRVEDVHGNSVTYTYDSLGRLTQISANDGRLITLGYNNSNQLIRRVTANGRQWTYRYSATSYDDPTWIANYAAASRRTLDWVQRPDGRRWTFDLDPMQARPGPGINCIQLNYTVSVTHPTGVRGDFDLSETQHRASYSARTSHPIHCPTEPQNYNSGGQPLHPADTTYMETMAVRDKTLTGPGIPTYTWSFGYEQDWNSTPGPFNTLCASTAANPALDCTNRSVVTEPDGRHITYYHLWNGENLGGKLLRMEIRQDSATGTLLETKEVDYLLEGGVGTTFAQSGPVPLTTNAPARTVETVVTRNGDSFTTTNTYNTNASSPDYSWGKPITVVRTTSLTPVDRIVDTTYQHDKPDWILGLTKTVTRNGKLFDHYDYDSLGRMTVHKRFGTTSADIWREYDYYTTGTQAGLVSRVTDPLNNETLLQSYTRGLPRTLVRPDGESLSRTVDNNGWVTSSTDAEGNTTDFAYNQIGWLTRVEPPTTNGTTADTVITYQFNSSGVRQTITKSNLETIVQYDGMLRAASESSRDTTLSGTTVHTRSEYDSQGRPTFQSFPSYSAAATAGVLTTYDGLGRVIRTENNVAPIAATRIDYFSNYRVRTTDPRGNATTEYWLAWGAPAASGPQGQNEDAPPWARDLLLAIDPPLAADQINAYDVYGNIDTVTVDGAVTNYDYDTRNRVQYVTDPDNYISETHYDANYRPIVTIDGEGRATRTVYDSLSRQTKIIRAWAGNPDGTGATLDCNVMRTNTQNNPASLQQCYREVNYTRNGKIHWVQDAKRNRTHYVYDDLDRLVDTFFPSKTTPGVHSTSDYERITYNALDQMTVKRTRSGQNIFYTTDAVGRLRDRLVPSAPTHSANGRTVSHSYTHDAWGHILTATHDGQTISYNYDDIGRVTSQTYAGNRTVSYTWDDANNLTRLTWPDGYYVDYDWDANNRIDRAYIGSRTLADVSYDAQSRRSLVTYDNGTSVLHNWSPRGDLDDHDHTFNGATLDYDFTYNGVGQMRSRSMSDTSFEWDQPSVGIDNYAVNGLNQYTSIDGASPGYDDNGNMTSNGLGRTYNYDAENVLRSVNGIAGGTATYRYHPDGSRRVKNHNGSQTLHYYMGGLGYLDAEDTAFAADQEIAEANSAGQLLKRFIRLPGSIDEAFLMIDVSGGTPVETWAHMNRLGSVVATTNASGTLQDKYRYSPYGMPGSEGAGGFPFRFTGQRMDAETGLYYYKARYYDPQIGRFLQTDPIGYDDQMNLYAYVGNDPVNLVDPTGNCSESSSNSEILCGIEDTVTDFLEPIVEKAMELGGVDVVPEEFRDPDGTLDHQAPDNTAGGELAGVTSAVGGAIVGRIVPGKRRGKEGSAGGDRSGKRHTRAAIRDEKASNAEANGGVERCVDCDVPTTPTTQRTKGSTVAPTEGQGDHVIPRASGGNGATVRDRSNIEIRCQRCNNRKSDN